MGKRVTEFGRGKPRMAHLLKTSDAETHGIALSRN